MRIKHLEIKNWIGIKELIKDFEKINFINGHKGAGKTAIIESIDKVFTNKNRRTEVIHHGEDEASLFLQTDDGLEITRKIRNGKADYMKVSKPGSTVPSTEKFLKSLINGDVFRPLDFVEKDVKEQAKIILNMLEINWTMDDIQTWFSEIPNEINYECHILQILQQIISKYYTERESINRDINALTIQVKGIKDELPANYDGDFWKAQILSQYYTKLAEAEENNKKLELAQACIEGLEGKILTIQAEANAQKSEKIQEFEKRKSDGREYIANLNRDIVNAQTIIDSVDGKIDEMITRKQLELEAELRQVNAKYEAIMQEEKSKIEQTSLAEMENIKQYQFSIAKAENQLQSIDALEATTLEGIRNTTTEKIKTAEAEAGSSLQATKELLHIDTAPLKTEAENVANMQSYLREWDRMSDIIINKLAPKQELSKTLTAKIEKARSLPQELLTLAKSPIDGLTVDSDGCIRIGETLIDGLSEGEQLELAFKVAKAQSMDAGLKVICVDGINKINASSRKWLETEMNTDEYQYFVLSTEDTELEIKTIA